MAKLIIESSGSKLILGPIETDYLNVTYTAEGVSICYRPYIYTDGAQLAKFFKSMANDWKGWDGTKNWSSIESDFQLKAVNNGTNKVLLSINLRKHVGADDDWDFQTQIALELGSLDEIAKEVEDIY